MPVPARLMVIVSVFIPVAIFPEVIFTVAAPTLLATVITDAPEVLLTVKILKVVAPVIVASLAPLNVTVAVPVPALKIPLFVKFLCTACENVPALNVVEELRVKSPATVTPAAAFLVFPFAMMRLL